MCARLDYEGVVVPGEFPCGCEMDFSCEMVFLCSLILAFTV